MQRLEAAGAKIELSSSQQTDEFALCDGRCQWSKAPERACDAGKAESLVEEFENSLIPCRTALKDSDILPARSARSSWSEVRHVCLWYRRKWHFFGKSRARNENPDPLRLVRRFRGCRLSGDVKRCSVAGRDAADRSIETMGGVAAPIIDKTRLFRPRSQVFSTADDNQTAVTIHVVQE